MTITPSITANRIKDIKTAFATLKPQKVTLDGNRAMTVKEAVFALAPTLERMKKRGFDITELVERLHEKGVLVKALTLAKYLNEFRRGKGKKADTAPPPEKPAPATKPQEKKSPTIITTPMEARAAVIQQREPMPGAFVVTPDTPDDEL